MILYGTSYSPFVRKILVTLAEKNITFEHVPVFFHAPDEAFQACSPLGKIPAFEDDGFRLADSSAISAYIEAKYPSPVLWPQAPKRAGARRLVRQVRRYRVVRGTDQALRRACREACPDG